MKHWFVYVQCTLPTCTCTLHVCTLHVHCIITSLHLLSGTYILEGAEHFCPLNSNAPLTEQTATLSVREKIHVRTVYLHIIMSYAHTMYAYCTIL